MARRSGLPGPSTSSWPRISSSVRGRIRSARGASGRGASGTAGGVGKSSREESSLEAGMIETNPKRAASGARLLDVFFGEYLSRRIERWVKAGRRPEARSAADGVGFVLEHGPRVRAFWAALALAFGTFLALGLWAHRTEALGSFWFMIGYVVMLGGAVVLSASMLIPGALGRWRAASNSRMPAATDTLRLSTPRAIGMATEAAARDRAAGASPAPSGPRRIATGSRRSASL